MASVFLGCFAFGVIFTVVTFALGAFGAHSFHLHGLHAPYGADAGGGPGTTGHGGHLSPFNLSTASAFLAWFGGAGYLLSRYSSLAALAVLALSGIAGLAGGAVVFVTLARLVFPRLTEMHPEDFQLPGTLAKVSSRIRPGGTGEIVYSLGDNRHVDGARSVGGDAIEPGTEVVIVRVERGIAYVERWDRFAAQNQLPPGGTGTA